VTGIVVHAADTASTTRVNTVELAMSDTPPTTPPEAEKLDEIFNKPAGDKAFYLRSELEPKLLALLDAARKEARTDERRNWLVVTRRVYNPKTGKPDHGRVPIGFFDDMHKSVEAQLSHPAPVHNSDKELD
jgi:hypothetical protein